MSVFEVFIRHRIGTSLLAVGVILLGLVAYFLLPVAALPQVDFPTLQVFAKLPGAGAETMATSVATPLENAFANISGITEMTSSSSLGVTQITLQFDLSKSITSAAQDVQTAINAAGGTLPKNLPNPPIFYKQNPADFAVLSFAVTSDTMPLTELDRYAEEFISKRLSQMPGVGFVDFNGEERPAVRIRLDPNKVAALGLTLDDIRSIVGAETVDSPKGSLDGPDQTVVLNATDQITTAEGYRSLVVAYRNGAPIRLRDLGSVIDAPEDIHRAGWLRDKRTIIIDIHKEVGSNVLDTIDGVKARLPALIASLPPAMQLQIVGDRTQTIRASVRDVQRSMMLSLGLVVLVMFAFLRNFRATLIPSVTIPISLIGTFGVMYLIGYSLDNLSLMALTIAIGFVVDDAIVVIENIVRHLELGASPVQAAVDGVREVGFTIVSMTISLIAVFIPILLMGGIVGRLFREFAVTVSVAILISGIVSLTVTPMMCAWMIRHESAQEHGPLYRWSERVFEGALKLYARGLDTALRHQVITLAIMLATVVLSVSLYVIVPKGFFPQVDTGIIVGVLQGKPDISFKAMSQKVQQIGHIIMDDPDVDYVYYWVGPNPTLSQARTTIALKPFEQRHSSASEVISRIKRKTAEVQGISPNLQIRQDLSVGGRISGAQYQYTLQDADVGELDKWSSFMEDKFRALPELRDVSSDRQALATSATFKIDRDTASRLGVSASAIDEVLYDAFGQRQIATLFTQLSQYHVIEEVEPRFQLSSAALKQLYVRSTTSKELVPLSLLGTLETGVSPVSINHQGLFPSTTLSFNLAPGYAIGDAVTAIHELGNSVGKPITVIGTFQGTAQAFQSSLKSQPWLILAALVVVYIVLGVLYESTIHPLTIISTLPSAGVGALLALMLFHLDLSVIALIGIFLLIGIVKKNAIMMIDFALVAERQQGLSPREAIREGALLRFRPIMMTTLAALLGALPLALGTGVGAELRAPLGIAIAGGLIVSQALTLYTTPVVYLWFDRLGKWALRGAAA